MRTLDRTPYGDTIIVRQGTFPQSVCHCQSGKGGLALNLWLIRSGKQYERTSTEAETKRELDGTK